MRLLGFAGIIALLPFALFGIVTAVLEGDLKGIVLMVFFVALLAMFGLALWHGRIIERRALPGERLAVGWAGQPVMLFIRNQVAKSPEGIIIMAGSALCLLFAILAALVPSVVALSADRSAKAAALFGMWPVLAFVYYVKICGPNYIVSVFSVVQMLCVIALPFVVAYK